MPWRENEGKANNVKDSTPEDRFFCSTTDRTDLADLLVEERDQKVSVGLGGVSPWAFRHRSLFKTSLGSSPMPQFPVLPCRTFQASRKQNSCRWQYKKAPLEPQRYPSPGERLRPPSSGVLPLTLLNLGCTRHSSSQLGSALICTRFQAAVSYRGLSWHTSSVGVPGYSWYCPPGSRVLCDAS